MDDATWALIICAYFVCINCIKSLSVFKTIVNVFDTMFQLLWFLGLTNGPLVKYNLPRPLGVGGKSAFARLLTS